jgi:hypothetical protein
MASKESMARSTSMTSGKGMASYPDGTMSKANRTSSECGPGSNPDMKKANGLLKKAFNSKESLRGQTGF